MSDDCFPIGVSRILMTFALSPHGCHVQQFATWLEAKSLEVSLVAWARDSPGALPALPSGGRSVTAIQ
jgi:hypothetical protein